MSKENNKIDSIKVEKRNILNNHKPWLYNDEIVINDGENEDKTSYKSPYLHFIEKEKMGINFLNAALKKRFENKSFLLEKGASSKGLMADIYGVYELLSICTNYSIDFKSFLKNDCKIEWKKEFEDDIANDIVNIYNYIWTDNSKYKDYTPLFTFNPVINSETSNYMRDNKKKYVGTMTWMLSLSSMLWRFFIEYGSNENNEYTKNMIVSSEENVEKIMSIKDKIYDTVKYIINFFNTNYLASKWHNKETNEDRVIHGWNFTNGCDRTSLYFTYSVLEAYSDFDSYVLLGADTYANEIKYEILDDKKHNEVEGDYFYYDTAIDELKNSDKYTVDLLKEFDRYYKDEEMEDTRPEFYNNLRGCPSLVKKLVGDNVDIFGFRNKALFVARTLFDYYKIDLMSNYLTDGFWLIPKAQIDNALSTANGLIFNTLYVLNNFLNGELNVDIRTKLMKAKFALFKFDHNIDVEKVYEGIRKNIEDAIKKYEKEYYEFEQCFEVCLNNVQKSYDDVKFKNRLHSINKYYYTFANYADNDTYLSEKLSQEHVLVGSLLPTIVNTTVLYVNWVSKFPNKKLGVYIDELLDTTCEKESKKNVEVKDDNTENIDTTSKKEEERIFNWVFEDSKYDLHLSVRSIDSIANFYDYYNQYEAISIENYFSDREKEEKFKKQAEIEAKIKVEEKNTEINNLKEENASLIKQKNDEIAEINKSFSFNNVIFDKLRDTLYKNREDSSSLSQYDKDYANGFIKELFESFVKLLENNEELKMKLIVSLLKDSIPNNVSKNEFYEIVVKFLDVFKELVSHKIDKNLKIMYNPNSKQIEMKDSEA